MKKITATILAVLFLIAGAYGCQKANQKNEKPVKLDSDKAKTSYAIGINIWQSLQNIKDEINIDLVIKGIEDKAKGSSVLLSDEEARTALMNFAKKRREKMQKEREEQAKKNLEEGKKFLEENKKKKGVVVTKSGLQYMVIKKGNGPKPSRTDQVMVNYKGSTIDGKVFDSTYESNKPAKVDLSKTIKGFAEAIQLMPVGSTYRVFLPPELGYGERGAGRIGPNSVLIFDIELLKIVKKQDQAK
ncbi:MAG: hypothetical protein B5M56_04230 [Desulfococcus sp. 4484_241]|nr:MAG: hypothetical protein B5M56_04230 [Desulfococcus sp. 4484_241]